MKDNMDFQGRME